MLQSFLATLEQNSAWLLDQSEKVVEEWVESMRTSSTPLYHEYIEGIFSEYKVQQDDWQQQGYSSTKILLLSIPTGLDKAKGVCRLTASRFRRALSFLCYGTEQMLTLSYPLGVFPESRWGLENLFRFLHWLTGDLGTKAKQVELKLSPTGKVQAWEQNASQLFKFEVQDALGKDAVGLFIPRCETGGRVLSDLIRGVCSVPEEYSLNVNENQDSRGDRFWMLWVNIPIYDQQTHELTGVLCKGIKIEDPCLMTWMVSLWQFGRRTLQSRFREIFE